MSVIHLVLSVQLKLDVKFLKCVHLGSYLSCFQIQIKGVLEN